jgi:MFS family permease
LFGGVWGLASVFGPTAGGFITDNLSWHWVFYVNVPVGIVALAVLLTTFPNMHHNTGTKKVIDWFGALTLIGAMTPLLVGLSLAGTADDWTWTSFNTLATFVVAAVFLVAFLFVETRVREPIIPLDLFKNRTFTLSVITVFLTGIGMFGAISYIPLFIQAVQGGSATSSGNAVTPMMLTVVFSSVVTGQLISRTGKYRVLGVVGMVLLTGGMFLLSSMNTSTPTWQTVVYMMVMGLGLGVAMPLYNLVVQNAFPITRLGVAMPLYNLVVQNAFPITRLGVVTSAVTFFRSIGGTVGIAVLGSIVNNRFRDESVNQIQQLNPQLASQLPAEFVSKLNPQVLVNPQAIEGMRQAMQAQHVPAALVNGIIDTILKAMKPALAIATTEAFLIGAVTLIIAIAATAFIQEIPLRKTNARPAMAMAEGDRPDVVQEREEALEAQEPVAVAGRR